MRGSDDIEGSSGAKPQAAPNPGALRALAASALLLALFLPACLFDLADVVPGGDGGVHDGCQDAKVRPEKANLTMNPSFENGEIGWKGNNAAISAATVAGAPDGCQAARVACESGSSDCYITEKDRQVSSSTAGDGYWVSAWVRSALPDASPSRSLEVAITLVESSDKPLSTSPSVQLVAGSSSFVEIHTTAMAKDGNSIGVRVSQSAPIAGDAFYVDLIQIVRSLHDAGADGG